MEPSGFFYEFIIAGAVGALIGIEREHRDDGAPVIAGVRTFPLISLSGFLVAYLAQEVGEPMITAFGVAGAFGLAFMLIYLRTSIGQTGITTPAAMVVTFLLGLLVAYHRPYEAVVVGVLTTFLLVTKKRLHRFAQVLDEQEILSALQFITVLFIVLPLAATLPRETARIPWVGRGNVLDPYVIVLVVVFVSTISFASLMAMRMVGASRGLEFSGLMGGLVNSEATTAGLAQRAKEQPTLVAAAVAGSLLASVTMLGRNLAIAAAAGRHFDLALAMLPYLLPTAVLGGLLAYRARSAASEPGQVVRVKNPFAVLPALRFALLFALVSLLAHLATTYLGEVGVYVTSLGGFVSAGAVVAGLASLHAQGGLTLAVALRASLLAVAASVLVKPIILRAVDRDTFTLGRWPYTLLGAVALAAAALSFALT